MSLSLALVQYFLGFVVGFGKGREVRARCFPLPFCFLHTARKPSLICKTPLTLKDYALLFSGHLSGPKAGTKGDASRKYTFRGISASAMRPTWTQCLQSLWAKDLQDTHPFQYREASIETMWFHTTLCELLVIHTCMTVRTVLASDTPKENELFLVSSD